MNRPIKFRAWWPDIKEMQYFTDIGFLGDDGILLMLNKTEMTDENYNGTYEINDQPLMQFTGLLDKNGKEIYEGDIIRYRKGNKTATKKMQMGRHKRIVEWRHTPMYTGFNISGGLFDKRDLPWEVIGNIYENAELLK